NQDFGVDEHDGQLQIADLYFNSDAVSKTDSRLAAQDGTLPGAKTSGPQECIRHVIDQHGSIILHVKGPTNDGHWIVVDEYDAKDGTFRVRDPWGGKVVPEAKIGGAGANYELYGDSSFKYVKSTQPAAI
ncbi:MAG TPA: hypothetical protein VGA61_15060, partial [Anaerolineae bacterium]